MIVFRIKIDDLAIKYLTLSLFMRGANVLESNKLVILLVITHCSWVIEKSDPIFNLYCERDEKILSTFLTFVTSLVHVICKSDPSF